MNLKKYKHGWIIPIYGIFYFISFVLLERSKVPIHMIHTKVDDWIPFCEYFIIPYLMWFIFVIGVVAYFTFCVKETKEYYQFIGTLGVGMTIFLIVSLVYPNGQDLRPELTGNNLFIQAVRVLYKLDTPTNILPSLHVFNAVACSIAICCNKACRKQKGITIGSIVLTIFIVLATMFLKQHSIVDVCLALVMNLLCYQIFYKLIPAHYNEITHLLTRKQIVTIPNLLSAFRCVLAVVFLGIYQRNGITNQRTVLTVILFISAMTDLLDGKIARRYHMVSEVGKILDPIADKVTQGVLLLCLFSRYHMIRIVFVLFVVKESYMAFMGAKTIMKTHKNDGAMWWGKLSTVVFYAVMVLLLLFWNIPESVANGMIGISGICMLLAFVLYAREYRRIHKEIKGEERNLACSDTLSARKEV